MMKIIRSTIVSLLTALITVVIIFGSYSLFAQTPESKVILGVVESAYHDDMNDFFNGKLEKLVDLLDDPNAKFYESENFLAPKKSEDCGEENLSTYCLSIEALDKYLAYVDKLNGMRSSLDFESTDSAQLLLQNLSSRNVKINQEIENAKKVLEATLAAYNEFRLAYPMHKEYEKIINNLVKYKIALEDIRRQVREFPLRFIDATSADCE